MVLQLLWQDITGTGCIIPVGARWIDPRIIRVVRGRVVAIPPEVVRGQFQIVPCKPPGFVVLA